jgi:nucleoside-diphosphate-sugar epimerase
MHVLILGAAGMIGRKLTGRLLKEQRIGSREISKLTLHDVVAPQVPANAPFPISASASDFSLPGEAEKLVASKPDMIFHLAAIVSGEAEADLDKGYRINLDGTRFLLDAIKKVGGGYKPRVVFTSSIAVFGAPFPDQIGDEFFNTPLTRAAASWKGLAFACRRFAFVRGNRTRPRPASSRISFASR